jgi:hypothetical protein
MSFCRVDITCLRMAGTPGVQHIGLALADFG